MPPDEKMIQRDADGVLQEKSLAEILSSMGIDLSTKVDESRTINGHALTADVVITPEDLDLNKADVGLDQVDNTPDASKPVSTVQQTALDDKVNKTRTVNGHALTGNVDVTKADVGLTNADDTSDANKPVSGPQGTALGLKVDKTTTVNGHALSGNIAVTKSDVSLGNADNTADTAKPVSTLQAAAIAQAITDLKDGVASPGDSLLKLYNMILGQSREITAATIAARNLLNITNLPTNVFVTDDGDGNWALYKATTTGVGATFVKISDPDLLNAVLTGSQIKTAYEAQADTNAFTNALKAIVQAQSGTNTGDETAARLAALDHAATYKAAIVDADEVVGMNSAGSFARIRTLWSDVKAYVKTYIDTFKDASGGYVGMTLFKINMRNAANTFTSFMTNAATAARTYTWPDKDITVAGIVDVDAKVEDAIVDGVTTKAPSQNVVFDQLALKAPLADPTFTGTVTLPNGTVALAKMANMATASLIYRRTAGSGAPEVNTLAQLKTDLSLAKGDVGLGSADNTADTAKPVSTAQQTALDLKAPLINPSFTTPVLGTPASGNLANCTFPTLNQNTSGSAASLSADIPESRVTNLVTDLAAKASKAGQLFDGGIGYNTGQGGAVTQLTSKATTTPAINKLCGTITMNAAALAAATIVSFTVANTTIGTNDIVMVTHDSGGTLGGYTVQANTIVNGTSFKISVRNNTAGSLSEAIVLRFVIIRGAVA